MLFFSFVGFVVLLHLLSIIQNHHGVVSYSDGRRRGEVDISIDDVPPYHVSRKE